MRNNQPLFIILFFMLIFAGNWPGLTMAGDRPVALEQDGGGVQPPPDAKPDTPPSNQEPRKPKAPEASGDFKPFKPSEEIEADQSVDFPYDI
jgi:hypothetical protein